MNSNMAEPASFPVPAREAVPMPHAWQGEELAAWREFTAGMEFLRRYSGHNTANAGVIGRDNLRLLHRSLLQDDGYRELLKSLRRKIRHQALPLRLDLTASQALCAHLISMPTESRIRLCTRPGHLSMFIVLHGAAHTQPRASTVRHHSWWHPGWQLGRRRDAESRPLHVEDIISTAHGNGDTLVAGKKHCILLAVLMPMRIPHRPEGMAGHQQADSRIPVQNAI